jgi:hypothetical protein
VDREFFRNDFGTAVGKLESCIPDIPDERLPDHSAGRITLRAQQSPDLLKPDRFRKRHAEGKALPDRSRRGSCQAFSLSPNLNSYAERPVMKHKGVCLERMLLPSNPDMSPIKRSYRQDYKNGLLKSCTVIHTRRFIVAKPLAIKPGLSISVPVVCTT